MGRVDRPMTLTEIAAQAGISVSTVSKVLNGRGDVAANTRERVAVVLREQGYRPASQRGFGVVDLLIGNMHSSWAGELVRGTVEAAAREDRSVVVTVLSATSMAEWERAVVGRGTDGILLAAHRTIDPPLRELINAGTPLVVVDPRDEPGPEDVPSVGTTNYQGGLVATRHLLALGHRRIAVIAGPTSFWSCRARLDGFRAAFTEAGLPIEESLVLRDELSPDAGRRQAIALLDAPEPPTAIVTANDQQAFGVLQALNERGVRAPADMSVVGFDDIPLAAWTASALTTVRQPLSAMAATAYQMLGLGDRPHLGPTRHIDLATSLVIRESTAPPSR